MKQRNLCVDYIRGIAILLVVLGHTISNNGMDDFADSGLFKVIFALQMPLFMLISGYVTKYSKPLNSGRALAAFLGRRSLAYLLPWSVWTIFRGFTFCGWTLENLKDKIIALLWNMDSGYWFLFVLWAICVIWGLGSFAANKIAKSKVLEIVFCAAVSAIFAIGLLILGIKAGMSFLGIKLILYCLPFFFVGHIYASAREFLKSKKYFRVGESTVVAVSFLLFVALSIRFNVYLMGESILEIAIRIACSLAGCIFAVYFSARFFQEFKSHAGLERLKAGVAVIGRESLGFYLIHYCFLNMIRLPRGTSFHSFEAFRVSLTNYTLTLFLSAVIVYIINRNALLRFLLFGKRK